MAIKTSDFRNWDEFYAFYLTEHSNGINRVLHIIATCWSMFMFYTIFITIGSIFYLPMALTAYVPAWIGHFFFEKNKPATFKYPLYSLISDYRMFKDLITGRLPLLTQLDEKIVRQVVPDKKSE
mmetsp:Transcript_10021/g.10945  ORF Transcript_10021/g.10945 Transcript_10021/m.10945 type:complete len:124 (-) Transcript_10021:163-534(-)